MDTNTVGGRVMEGVCRHQQSSDAGSYGRGYTDTNKVVMCGTCGVLLEGVYRH